MSAGQDDRDDSNRRALVEAILEAAPDDDEPHLVYADYLQHRGDPRGELIAMQTRALREPSPELARRERQLLDDHEATWLGPWHRIANKWDFQRGLLHALTADLGAFADMARDIVAIEPLSDHLVHLRSLVLEDIPGRDPDAHAVTVAGIARDAPLRLERFGIHHAIRPGTATVYAGSRELLVALTHLSISQGFHVTGTLATLWRSPHLGRLRSLELRDASLTDDEAVELSEQPLFARLRELIVRSKAWPRRNQIEQRGAAALASHPRLVHLDLGGHHELGDDLLHALARAAPPLRSLNLHRTHVTSASAGLYAQLPTLESLDLRGTHIDDNALTPILALRHLRSLNIAHTRVTAEGAAQILRDARPALRELTIAIPELDAITAHQLATRFELHRYR